MLPLSSAKEVKFCLLCLLLNKIAAIFLNVYDPIKFCTSLIATARRASGTYLVFLDRYFLIPTFFTCIAYIFQLLRYKVQFSRST